MVENKLSIYIADIKASNLAEIFDMGYLLRKLLVLRGNSPMTHDNVMKIG